MKIAITSNGNTFESQLSKVFARCEYFLIYDTDNRSHEFVENPYRTQNEHVGEDVARFLGEKGIKRIIASEFGSKAKKVTDEFNIQLVVVPDEAKTIASLLEMMKSHG